MDCPQLSLMLMFFIILFSQYMRKFSLPIGSYKCAPLRWPLGSCSSYHASHLGLKELVWTRQLAACLCTAPAPAPSMHSPLLPCLHAAPRPHNNTHRLRIFELFPVLLGIAVTWIIGAILTASGTYDNSSAAQQANCKTNNLKILNDAPWIRFPYPGALLRLPARSPQAASAAGCPRRAVIGCAAVAAFLRLMLLPAVLQRAPNELPPTQLPPPPPLPRGPDLCCAGQWGAPIFSWPSVLTMLAGALSAMVESLGELPGAGMHLLAGSQTGQAPLCKVHTIKLLLLLCDAHPSLSTRGHAFARRRLLRRGAHLRRPRAAARRRLARSHTAGAVLYAGWHLGLRQRHHRLQ
jgi:hypothetical protein